MLLISTTIITEGLSTNFIDNDSYTIFATIGLHYLSYPLFGLLGEKWMRYKVILFEIILMFVGLLLPWLHSDYTLCTSKWHFCRGSAYSI